MVRTDTSQQGGSVGSQFSWIFLCGVCIFSLCLCRGTPGTPVFFHPKNMPLRLLGNNKSCLGFIYINECNLVIGIIGVIIGILNMSENLSIFICTMWTSRHAGWGWTISRSYMVVAGQGFMSISEQWECAASLRLIGILTISYKFVNMQICSLI